MFLGRVGQALAPAELVPSDRNVCSTAVLVWTFLREKWFPRSPADVAPRVRRSGAMLRKGNGDDWPVMRPWRKRAGKGGKLRADGQVRIEGGGAACGVRLEAGVCGRTAVAGHRLGGRRYGAIRDF